MCTYDQQVEDREEPQQAKIVVSLFPHQPAKLIKVMVS